MLFSKKKCIPYNSSNVYFIIKYWALLISLPYLLQFFGTLADHRWVLGSHSVYSHFNCNWKCINPFRITRVIWVPSSSCVCLINLASSGTTLITAGNREIAKWYIYHRKSNWNYGRYYEWNLCNNLNGPDFEEIESIHKAHCGRVNSKTPAGSGK